MHIPDAMLQGRVCPVTAFLSTVGLIAGVRSCYTSKNSPSAARFGAISAFIFAVQMINFPIMHGTSGHLIGGVVAAGLLGIPFGILSMALIIALQCLFFGDGGVVALGANIFNMALVGAGVAGLLRNWLASKINAPLATALAAWCSIMLAAASASIELAIDGQIALHLVLPAMLKTHALIGIGEAAASILLLSFLSMPALSVKQQHASVSAPLAAASIIALILSPFASKLPGALEWVAEQYNFAPTSQQIFEGIFPQNMVSTGFAGLAGVLLTFGTAWALFILLSRYIKSQPTLRFMNR